MEGEVVASGCWKVNSMAVCWRETSEYIYRPWPSNNHSTHNYQTQLHHEPHRLPIMKLIFLIFLLTLAASTAAIDAAIYLKTSYCSGKYIICFNLGPDVRLILSFHSPH
jgi:hypothetical protein